MYNYAWSLILHLISNISRKRPRHDSEEHYSTLPKGSGILSQEMEDLKGVYYRPRTKESRGTYELLLSFIQQSLGDQVCVPSVFLYIQCG